MFIISLWDINGDFFVHKMGQKQIIRNGFKYSPLLLLREILKKPE